LGAAADEGLSAEAETCPTPPGRVVDSDPTNSSGVYICKSIVKITFNMEITYVNQKEFTAPNPLLL
jgi:hypothetical protein